RVFRSRESVDPCPEPRITGDCDSYSESWGTLAKRARRYQAAIQLEGRRKTVRGFQTHREKFSGSRREDSRKNRRGSRRLDRFGRGIGAVGWRSAPGGQAQGHASRAGDLCICWFVACRARAEIRRPPRHFQKERQRSAGLPLPVGNELPYVRVRR